MILPTASRPFRRVLPDIAVTVQGKSKKYRRRFAAAEVAIADKDASVHAHCVAKLNITRPPD